jgi:hypothetical protein
VGKKSGNEHSGNKGTKGEFEMQIEHSGYENEKDTD